MVLKTICSHWLTCAWILWILFGLAVTFFERSMYPSWFFAIKSWPLDLIKKKWRGRWGCPGKIHHRIEEEHMRIGQSHQGGIDAIRRREDPKGAAGRRHEPSRGASARPERASPRANRRRQCSRTEAATRAFPRSRGGSPSEEIE